MFVAAEPAVHGAQPERVDKADLSRWGCYSMMISAILVIQMCSGVLHPVDCRVLLIGDGILALESLEPSG